MYKIESLVIGAGPSGLSVAYGLQGDTLVLEKESSVGGLCRSIIQGNGIFDIGGHSFHTPHSDVFELIWNLLEGKLHYQQRDARIYSHGTLIPYPFQKHYDQLPDPDVVRACEDGLRDVEGNAETASNFEEYILRKFGKGIAEHFMLPYNRKLWARDIKKMSGDWTSERIAAPKGEEERFDTSGGKRKPLQSDTRVGYPAQGGFEEIWRAFVPHLPAIELNTAIVSIDPYAKIATASDGKQYQWGILVSTLPLPVLVRIVNDTPADIIALADQLEYMSLRVELLLAGRRLETPIQRIYVASPDIPPHKIALNHNSSDYLRQRQQHAIMAEVSVSSQKSVNADEIAPRTIDLLCEIDVLDSPADIIWQGHVDVHYAYPVYTHNRPFLVQAIKEWMAGNGIYTLGRFGDWEYINSDKCVMKGLSLATELRRAHKRTNQ